MQLLLALLVFNSKPDNLKKGIDERFPIIEQNYDLNKIYFDFQKKEVLDKLIRKDISLNEKVKIWNIYKNNFVEENISTNIFEGGLLDDWDFNF